MQAADRTHGDGLHTIEQLKPRRHHHQPHCQLEDAGKGRVIAVDEQSHQLLGQQQEQRGEGKHQQRTKANTDPPGTARCKQVAAAVIQADPHGHRIRQPGRHHERGRDDLQGDLMRRQLGAAEHTHAQRGEGEQADFDHVRAANRQAQPPQLAQRRQRWPRQALAQRVGVVEAVPADIQRQGDGHAQRDQRGDQANADQAEFGQTEHALDQRMVEQVVEHRADQADDHHRRRPAKGAGEAAQGHKRQVAG